LISEYNFLREEKKNNFLTGTRPIGAFLAESRHLAGALITTATSPSATLFMLGWALRLGILKIPFLDLLEVEWMTSLVAVLCIVGSDVGLIEIILQIWGKFRNRRNKIW